jgi:molybdate transport system regulatory protein
MGRPPKKSTPRPRVPAIEAKLRVAGGVVGPGKISLLELIEREGSISAAARCMGMSFRRAWHLIDTLNAALGRPVVATEVGGSQGGGARLTDFGRELVARYRQTMSAIGAEAAPLVDWIEKALRDKKE